MRKIDKNMFKGLTDHANRLESENPDTTSLKVEENKLVLQDDRRNIDIIYHFGKGFTHLEFRSLPYNLNIELNPRLTKKDVKWVLTRGLNIFLKLFSVRSMDDKFYPSQDDSFGNLNLWKDKNGNEYVLCLTLGNGNGKVPLGAYIESPLMTFINIEGVLLTAPPKVLKEQFFDTLLGRHEWKQVEGGLDETVKDKVHEVVRKKYGDCDQHHSQYFETFEKEPKHERVST